MKDIIKNFMKNELMTIIIVIMILIIVYLSYNYLFPKQSVQFYKDCCFDKYNGILNWNDCSGLSPEDKCVYEDKQFGYNCIFMVNTTHKSIPIKSMNCSVNY